MLVWPRGGVNRTEELSLRAFLNWELASARTRGAGTPGRDSNEQVSNFRRRQHRSPPFDFALSKIPTSRAKTAREMGHPRFSSPPAASLLPFANNGKGWSTRHYFSLTFSDNSRNSLACLWLAFICSWASCREFSVVRIGARASSSVATSRA